MQDQIDQLHLIGLLDVDTVNYKKISYVLEFPYCSMKCGADVCQNAKLNGKNVKTLNMRSVIENYLSNGLSKAIVMQGMEPLDSFDEVKRFISLLRDEYHCNDDIVIFTGYNHNEVEDKIASLSAWPNIIVKFGRYIPGQESHYDIILGVELASDNQYAERIS